FPMLVPTGSAGIKIRWLITVCPTNGDRPPPMANCSNTGASAVVAPYSAEPEIGGNNGVRMDKPTVAEPRENERSNDLPSVPDAPTVPVRLEASPRLVHVAAQSTNPKARVV